MEMTACEVVTSDRAALAIVDAPRPARLVSMSRTGRYVVTRHPGGLEIVDALGTAPRIRVDGHAIDFACVGTMLWVLRDRRIDRYALGSGRSIEPAIALPDPGSMLVADRSEGAHTAIVVGPQPMLAVGQHAHTETAMLPADARQLAPLGGRSFAAAMADRVVVHELGRREPIGEPLRTSDEVLAVHALFGRKILAALVRSSAEDTWWVVRPDGTRLHRIVTAHAARWAVAGEAGLALVMTADRWSCIDLRYGHVRADGAMPFPVFDLDLSADGQHVLLAQDDHVPPALVHMPATELPSSARADADPAPPDLVAVPTVVDASLSTATDVVDDAGPPDMPVVATVVPPTLPLALGAPLPPLELADAEHWPIYASAREHLDDMLDLVAARAARAIARAWNSGQISAGVDRQPFDREVRALLGDVPGFAPHELGAADDRLVQMATRNAGRVRSTIAAGIRLPFIELMRELDLSPTAGHLMMIALAPSERGEIARLFGILGNDPHRPVVDRFLLETVIAGPDRQLRAEVAAALADDAPLRRHGVLRVTGDPGLSTFQTITVDPIVIARLCDRIDLDDARPVRSLEQLVIPAGVVGELLDVLARPRSNRDGVRVVLRGRLGSGRRSLLAALAGRIGRTIGEVDCTRLPRAGVAMAAALERELGRIVLRGAIPIVSGLEAADPADTEGQDRIRQVLRAHPGPLAVRTTPEASLPLDRGVASITLRPLTETERAGFWRAALARAGLCCGDVDGLAARWRIGPGIVENVIAQVSTCELASGADATAALDDIARQHIASRLGNVATPIRRLAAWENVALADDVRDSIREFIGRIAQRRTVFEDWGFDAKVATARGLTALFYGPPGTGKSMVAGLIARELGLELYRVDLARIVSKWIGETEKHLAEVFDAAEDGQVVILFDEADSLFAKRTEVKTSVDRYANLEVNYLLQRLDTFEGIAILTTNLDGSIDPAFKRRMSLRLQFPFPDEDMRRRLWAAHIPNKTPIAGDFNFGELARRFPLSGGYIRNSALRAAFLAAQERRPMGQEHLLRAIALEYRELGKLATDGRME